MQRIKEAIFLGMIFAMNSTSSMVLTTKIIPVTTEGYGLGTAARTVNSRLDKSKLVEKGFHPRPI